MNDILFEILKAVMVLAIILVTRYAVPYIKMKLESSKQEWLEKWIDVAVRSAEQTVFGDKQGAEKKRIVTEFIRQQLIKKNISISYEQLNNLIEAAVFAMNGEK